MATATHLITEDEAASHPKSEAVVVRFAGDSGDGMQLTGGQFTLSTALAGNDLATFPDFPAEIRAPQGTTFGVSAFQINFGSTSIETAGDQPDVLIAMNPAALKVNADQLREGGLIIADEGEKPWATAKRELEEETGIPPRLVERIAECPERLKYDLPPELRGKLWGGKWKGQLQDWYLARFLGDDSDVNIATKDPEFNDWKWVDPDDLPDLIVPFKRDLYRRLVDEFREYF